ncbi:precorrin-2 C(20)-methyltransferase [Vibrio sonorensis]|uniref:precorrin-2 C(20)-methyltransferase n=1 Tax=Vibrio sonorensis TaxID=1004316 RepID=UPI0008DA927E|nr:precorrin-2 C(20)-methyltransferase [Vibrio sonorensis]
MTISSLGKLYAVGVGTGDSELLTLKAVRLIKEADVIAIPEKNKGKADSFAWQIVTGAVPEAEISAESCYLHFPMTRDPSVNIPAWQTAAHTILQRLQAGKNVVFITEGDPSVFSTWSYVQDELSELIPELKPVIVPGITSITAVPAATKIPLAEGKEKFCVVPATYGIECLENLVKEFDTIMLIKAGRMIPALSEKLKKLGIHDVATYVSHASSEQEEIYDDLDDVPNSNRYFSMVQLSIRTRKGVLRGQQPITVEASFSSSRAVN